MPSPGNSEHILACGGCGGLETSLPSAREFKPQPTALEMISESRELGAKLRIHLDTPVCKLEVSPQGDLQFEKDFVPRTPSERVTNYSTVMLNAEFSLQPDHEGRMKYTGLKSLEIIGCRTEDAAVAHALARTSVMADFEEITPHEGSQDRRFVIRQGNSASVVFNRNDSGIGAVLSEFPALRAAPALAPLLNRG